MTNVSGSQERKCEPDDWLKPPGLSHQAGFVRNVLYIGVSLSRL